MIKARTEPNSEKRQRCLGNADGSISTHVGLVGWFGLVALDLVDLVEVVDMVEAISIGFCQNPAGLVGWFGLVALDLVDLVLVTGGDSCGWPLARTLPLPFGDCGCDCGCGCDCDCDCDLGPFALLDGNTLTYFSFQPSTCAQSLHTSSSAIGS
jgi:hypothetical protein